MKTIINKSYCATLRMKLLLHIVLISTIVFACCQNVGGQITFPSSDDLPLPEPCPGEETFCGDDTKKYPYEQIEKIVNLSIELRVAPEATERFFGAEEPSDLGVISHKDDESLKPTCDYRNELVPNFARAKNVLGKWVYLVEAANKKRQYVKIALCMNPGDTCHNDIDSPHGEGSTVCKQLFRTQKLLAMDENGEMVVDTFKLPSACTCNYKGRFGVNLRDALGGIRGKQPPKCTVDNATQNLEVQIAQPNNQQGGKRLELEDAPSQVEPCDPGEVLCDAEDDLYPKKSIEKMLRTHVAFRSPKFFGTVFGDICEPQDPDSQLTVRNGFDIQESELCDSFQKYIYPKKAKNIHNEWHYIINTDEYRQGVTVDLCLPRVKDASCLYGGSEGKNPSSTICKQKFSVHYMLGVKADGSVAYEPFYIPSSCACYEVQEDEQIFFSSR